MKTPQWLALEQVYVLCLKHVAALREALQDMGQRTWTAAALENLARDDRRLLDQFAYRYIRLQDDMGARLMPAILNALGEDSTAMPALDRFYRLEQIGWLPSADEWLELRQIRNAFAHDYPETPAEHLERFLAAVSAAQSLVGLMEQIGAQINQRFGLTSQGESR